MLGKSTTNQSSDTACGMEDIYGKDKLSDSDMRCVIRSYESNLLRYAQRLVCDFHSAEDIVQSAFVKLFRSWKKIKNREQTLNSWLYRVVHNEAVDLIRKENNYKNLLNQHAEEKKFNDSRTNNDQKEYKKQLILKNIDCLAPAEKDVFLLRLEEGLSYKDIALITNRSVGNVGKLLHRAVVKVTKAVRYADSAV